MTQTRRGFLGTLAALAASIAFVRGNAPASAAPLGVKDEDVTTFPVFQVPRGEVLIYNRSLTPTEVRALIESAHRRYALTYHDVVTRPLTFFL